jgi:hypothetical protein
MVTIDEIIKWLSCAGKLKAAKAENRRLQALLDSSPLNDPLVIAAIEQARADYAEMETSGDV